MTIPFKELWIDVDGVLLDYTGPFLKFIDSDVQSSELSSYDLSFLFGGSHRIMGKAMEDFSRTLDYGNLEAIAPAEALHNLKNYGFTLNIITQTTDDPIVRARRVSNLTRVFGIPFSNILFTKRGQCKLDVIHKWKLDNDSKESYMLIEDNPVILEKFSELSKDNKLPYPSLCMAIKHQYNADRVEGLQAVAVSDSFEEAATRLLLGAIKCQQ